jgi:hypothetical protein
MTTTTTASRTKATSDPWVREIESPPYWRFKLQVPRAVLAQHGHQQVAQALAQFGPHPVCLQHFGLGRSNFVVLSSMEQASAAAGAIRSL